MHKEADGELATEAKRDVRRVTPEIVALRRSIRSGAILTDVARLRSRVERAKEYLPRLELQLASLAQLPADLSLSGVAYILDLGRTYCCSVFREISGKPYCEWWRDIRIRKAKMPLLDLNRSITEVAQIAGFEDVTTFSRNCRIVLGMSPTSFRKLHHSLVAPESDDSGVLEMHKGGYTLSNAKSVHPSLTVAKDAVWAGIARGYGSFGQPFVPGCEDIRVFEKAVVTQAHTSGNEGIHAIMLGVTPGIALMHWPRNARITAVDSSAAVIASLWPGDIPNVRKAVCAQWTAIPVDPGSCDVVIGDGSLNVCRYPNEMGDVCRAAHALLKNNGILVVRNYVRPQEPETVDAVMEELFSRGGLDIDPFKMRLYLALHRSPRKGVAVKNAARVLERYGIDQKVMRERLGWAPAAIQPFLSWPVSTAIYTFPTLEELRAVLCEYFDEVSVDYPSYEMGRFCPTIVLRARRSEPQS